MEDDSEKQKQNETHGKPPMSPESPFREEIVLTKDVDLQTLLAVESEEVSASSGYYRPKPTASEEEAGRIAREVVDDLISDQIFDEPLAKKARPDTTEMPSASDIAKVSDSIVNIDLHVSPSRPLSAEKSTSPKETETAHVVKTNQDNLIVVDTSENVKPDDESSDALQKNASLFDAEPGVTAEKNVQKSPKVSTCEEVIVISDEEHSGEESASTSYRPQLILDNEDTLDLALQEKQLESQVSEQLSTECPRDTSDNSEKTNTDMNPDLSTQSEQVIQGEPESANEMTIDAKIISKTNSDSDTNQSSETCEVTSTTKICEEISPPYSDTESEEKKTTNSENLPPVEKIHQSKDSSDVSGAEGSSAGKIEDLKSNSQIQILFEDKTDTTYKEDEKQTSSINKNNSDLEHAKTNVKDDEVSTSPHTSTEPKVIVEPSKSHESIFYASSSSSTTSSDTDSSSDSSDSVSSSYKRKIEKVNTCETEEQYAESIFKKAKPVTQVEAETAKSTEAGASNETPPTSDASQGPSTATDKEIIEEISSEKKEDGGSIEEGNKEEGGSREEPDEGLGVESDTSSGGSPEEVGQGPRRRPPTPFAHQRGARRSRRVTKYIERLNYHRKDQY